MPRDLEGLEGFKGAVLQELTKMPGMQKLSAVPRDPGSSLMYWTGQGGVASARGACGVREGGSALDSRAGSLQEPSVGTRTRGPFPSQSWGSWPHP